LIASAIFDAAVRRGPAANRIAVRAAAEAS
jgi:hypothetical protein